MSTNFEDRSRGTFEQALDVLRTPSNMISHILENDDGTFSVMSHIVCEFCDYCAEQKDEYHDFPAKPDLYELQKATIVEWEREEGKAP